MNELVTLKNDKAVCDSAYEALTIAEAQAELKARKEEVHED